MESPSGSETQLKGKFIFLNDTEDERERFLLENKREIFKLAIYFALPLINATKKERVFFCPTEGNMIRLLDRIKVKTMKKDSFKRSNKKWNKFYKRGEVFSYWFSDELYHAQGMENSSRLFLRSSFLIRPNKGNYDFQFKILSDKRYEELKNKEKARLIKVRKIPITFSQVIQRCIEEDPTLISDFDVNGENGSIILDSESEKILLMMKTSIFGIIRLFNPDKAKQGNVEDAYYLSFVLLYLYNSVLFLVNPDCELFSATPFTNIFSLKLYFLVMDFYLPFQKYKNFLKEFERFYSSSSISKFIFLHKEDNEEKIFKFLLRCSLCEERGTIKKRAPRDVMKKDDTCQLSAKYVRDTLKDFMKKFHEEEQHYSPEKRMSEEMAIKSCLKVINIFLKVVYKLNDEIMRRLSYDELLNVILGFFHDPRYNESYEPSTPLGFPSLVLYAVEVNPMRHYEYKNIKLEKYKDPREWVDFERIFSKDLVEGGFFPCLQFENLDSLSVVWGRFKEQIIYLDVRNPNNEDPTTLSLSSDNYLKRVLNRRPRILKTIKKRLLEDPNIKPEHVIPCIAMKKRFTRRPSRTLVEKLEENPVKCAYIFQLFSPKKKGLRTRFANIGDVALFAFLKIHSIVTSEKDMKLKINKMILAEKCKNYYQL